MKWLRRAPPHTQPGLLYPRIGSQRVEATAKWMEQSTDVNYEINPEHRQLEERPKHQYPKARPSRSPGTRPVPTGKEGFSYPNPGPHIFSQAPIDNQGRKSRPPPLFFFFRWRGDGGAGVGGGAQDREKEGEN